MKNVHGQLVSITKKEVENNPGITNEQLDGYLSYLGVFVPHMREKIINEARPVIETE